VNNKQEIPRILTPEQAEQKSLQRDLYTVKEIVEIINERISTQYHGENFISIPIVEISYKINTEVLDLVKEIVKSSGWKEAKWIALQNPPVFLIYKEEK